MWISKNPHTALKDWYIGAKVTSKIQRHKAWAKSGARGVKAEEKGKSRGLFSDSFDVSGYKLGLFYLYVGWLSCNCLIVIMIVTGFPVSSLSIPSVSKLISTNNWLAPATHCIWPLTCFLYLVIIRHTVSHHRQILSDQWRSFLLSLDYRYFIQTFFNRCTIKAAKPPKHIQHSIPPDPLPGIIHI